MRSILVMTTFISAGTVVFFASADEPAATKGNKKPLANAAAKAAEKNAPKAATTSPAPAQSTPAQSTAARHAADEAQIRQAAETYVKAYNAGNAKGVAALFAVDAEYVNEEGDVTQGREAIEQGLAAHFNDNPGEKVVVRIESIRFLNPGLAVEDGSAGIVRADGSKDKESSYTAIHVKSDGKWQMASVRDHASDSPVSRAEQLKQLEWMIGDWVNESSDALIDFTVRPVDDGNFLLREFTVRIAGRPAMSGSQRIGWDKVSRQFRVWTFDSTGGFLEGILYGSGDRWTLRSTGQTAAGEAAAATGIFTSVNGHTMTWQNVEYVVDGVETPAAAPVRIVRKAPRIDLNAP